MFSKSSFSSFWSAFRSEWDRTSRTRHPLPSFSLSWRRQWVSQRRAGSWGRSEAPAGPDAFVSSWQCRPKFRWTWRGRCLLSTPSTRLICRLSICRHREPVEGKALCSNSSTNGVRTCRINSFSDIWSRDTGNLKCWLKYGFVSNRKIFVSRFRWSISGFSSRRT